MRISDWSSDVCSSDLTPQALVALDDAAVALARDLRVDRIEYRLREALHPDWPCNRETYVTFRKEIAREVEQNMLAIPRKQRAMVRKGIKENLAEEIDRSEEHTSELQSLMSISYAFYCLKKNINQHYTYHINK